MNRMSNPHLGGIHFSALPLPRSQGEASELRATDAADKLLHTMEIDTKGGITSNNETIYGTDDG